MMCKYLLVFVFFTSFNLFSYQYYDLEIPSGKLEDDIPIEIDSNSQEYENINISSHYFSETSNKLYTACLDILNREILKKFGFSYMYNACRNYNEVIYIKINDKDGFSNIYVSLKNDKDRFAFLYSLIYYTKICSYIIQKVNSNINNDDFEEKLNLQMYLDKMIEILSQS